MDMNSEIAGYTDNVKSKQKQKEEVPKKRKLY